MSSEEFLKLSKKAVVDYFNQHTDPTSKFSINEQDVFIVWSCKPCRIIRPWSVQS